MCNNVVRLLYVCYVGVFACLLLKPIISVLLTVYLLPTTPHSYGYHAALLPLTNFENAQVLSFSVYIIK